MMMPWPRVLAVMVVRSGGEYPLSLSQTHTHTYPVNTLIVELTRFADELHDVTGEKQENQE